MGWYLLIHHSFFVTEGIEDDSYENITLNIPSPARVTKTESVSKK